MKSQLRSCFTLMAVAVTCLFENVSLQGAIPSPGGKGHVAASTPSISDLVSWWQFEQNANDRAGDNDALLQSNAGFTPGYAGSALDLTPGGACAKIPASRTLNVGTNSGMTIEGWVKPTDVSQIRQIMEWNNGNGGIGTHLAAGVVDAGNLYANLVDTDGVTHLIASEPGVLTNGGWQHVALTYDRVSGVAVLYANGNVVAESELGQFIPQTSYNCFFGTRPSGPFAGSYWAGGLDEMSLFKRALTANEVGLLFTNGTAVKLASVPIRTALGLGSSHPSKAPSSPRGLVSWWRFESNGNDTAGGQTAELSSGTQFIQGYSGFALGIPQNGAYAKVGASRLLDVGLGSGFSVSAWIKPSDLSHLRPIVEWNDGRGRLGVHLWVGVDTGSPGDGDRDLFANLIDTQGNSHQIRTPANLIQTGVWQFVTLTYDQTSGQAALYCNGAVVAQNQLGQFVPQTSMDLYFGWRPSGSFSGIFWEGGLDEITLFNRALPSKDVTTLFQRGVIGPARSVATFSTGSRSSETAVAPATPASKSRGKGELRPPRIENVVVREDGSALIQASAAPGKTCVIQVSTDVVNWRTIGSAEADENGILQLEDEGSGTLASRFYRVMLKQ